MESSKIDDANALKKAKSLYFSGDCNYFFMERKGILQEYESLNVPEYLELQWKLERVRLLVDSFDSGGADVIVSKLSSVLRLCSEIEDQEAINDVCEKLVGIKITGTKFYYLRVSETLLKQVNEKLITDTWVRTVEHYLLKAKNSTHCVDEKERDKLLAVHKNIGELRIALNARLQKTEEKFDKVLNLYQSKG